MSTPEHEQLKELIETGEPVDWAVVETVWRGAEGFYEGPVGFWGERSIEEQALERVVEAGWIPDAMLFDGLADPSAYLAAYAFTALTRRQSPLVRAIPSVLKHRDEEVVSICGCMVVAQSLADFARHRHNTEG